MVFIKEIYYNSIKVVKCLLQCCCYNLKYGIKGTCGMRSVKDLVINASGPDSFQVFPMTLNYCHFKYFIIACCVDPCFV